MQQMIYTNEYHYSSDSSKMKFKNEIYSHFTFLTTFAIHLTKNSDDAKDLVQDTIYKALKHQSKFAEGSNLKAWLTTILKNSFINNYRKLKRRTQLDFENPIISNNEFNKGESNFLLKEIQSEINKLDSEYRIPFLLAFDGFKYDEIAENLNIPLGTVKSRIFNARRILKEKLFSLYPKDIILN